MAFFPIYQERPPANATQPRPSKPRLLSRRMMPEPIIRRGPFALIWINPDPPERRDRDDGRSGC